jgi:hypothetical protein
LVAYSNNENSLCLVKKLISNSYTPKQTGISNRTFLKFKKKIEDNIVDIMKEHFGNYVIHDVLDNWTENEYIGILDEIIKNSKELCRLKYSSKTLLRCIDLNTHVSDIFLERFLEYLSSLGRNLIGKLVFSLKKY